MGEVFIGTCSTILHPCLFIPCMISQSSGLPVPPNKRIDANHRRNSLPSRLCVTQAIDFRSVGTSMLPETPNDFRRARLEHSCMILRSLDQMRQLRRYPILPHQPFLLLRPGISSSSILPPSLPVVSTSAPLCLQPCGLRGFSCFWSGFLGCRLRRRTKH